MKKYVLFLLLFMGCSLCYGQRYSLSSFKYTIMKAPDYDKKEYVRHSTIIVDLNKSTIEVRRMDKTFYLRILQTKKNANGGRTFKCVDITGGRNIECWVNYDSMSALTGNKLFQMWFAYNNGSLNAYYDIKGD